MTGTWNSAKYLLKHSQCHSQDSNCAPLKFKSALHQPAQLLKYKVYNKTYQVKVCAIGVTVGVRCVHSQGHTIGKDGQQNQVLKWSVSFVKENTTNST